MASSFTPDPAEGWTKASADIPFMVHVGPLWHRICGDAVEYGFMPRPEIHGNRFGRLHGGMITALADYALGHACWMAGGKARPFVTVHLGVDFVSAGSPAIWTTCLTETVRETRSLVFMQGKICADGRVLATASGVWKAISPMPDTEGVTDVFQN